MSVKPVNPLDLPRDVDGHGYLYVTSFSTGLVKVGSTKNPYVRMSTYRTTLTPFDITITDCWVSSPVKNYLSLEAGAIKIVASMATDTRQSEYFHGVNFPDAIAAIEAWNPNLRPPAPPAPAPRNPCVEFRSGMSDLYFIDSARHAKVRRILMRSRLRRHESECCQKAAS